MQKAKPYQAPSHQVVQLDIKSFCSNINVVSATGGLPNTIPEDEADPLTDDDLPTPGNSGSGGGIETTIPVYEM